MGDNMIQFVDTRTSSKHKNITDLILYNCGSEPCSPNQDFGPIARDFNLIHFVLKGRGKLVLDKETYNIEKGQAFLIPANKAAYYQADEYEPWEYSWVGFMGIKSEMYLQNISLVQDNPYVVSIGDITFFHSTILEMLRIGNNTLSSSLAIQGYLCHILAKLVHESGETMPVKEELPYSVQAINYMEKNYNGGIQISEVAEYLGLHPNYLTSVFKQEIGETPKQYLMNIRIKKACELLQDTSYSIQVISNSVGYSDQLTFSRAFKNMMGISPSAYREKTL
ncbi:MULTISPECIES: AraC family transcriptional regulator [Paenibacillus]|uniref:AraC family transcriptional regulator n=1 Tax=Paenibacillus TaxID=44249 RepID=UPI000737BC1B|nr:MULTISPECIES: AraC family transcriptional regulator [Paenibacillus]KAF6568544.1 AraC family transcriptional regulator [Paenibacillus sp. EKM202P]KAF6570389.1 AraC family transcriptional regulator [Paenibacillus sp. EKM207P]